MAERTESGLIEVKSDTMHGFSQLLVGSLMYGPNAKEALNAFGGENNEIAALPDVFSNLLSNDHNKKMLFANIGQVRADIHSGKISAPQELAETFTAGMSGAEDAKQAIMNAYSAYAGFCESHKAEMEQTESFLHNLQNDEKYGWNHELAAVNRFFHLPEGQKYNLYLNPYAGQTLGSGVYDKSSDSINMNYSMAHNEPEENYLRGSNILERRTSTPFHEATHAAFEACPLMDEINNNEALQTMLRSMNAQYNSPNNSTEHGLLSEGFAAAASAVMNNKLTGKPDNNGEYYHNWTAADRLARCVYPVFREYLKQGRALDDSFLQRVVENGNMALKRDAKVQESFAGRKGSEEPEKAAEKTPQKDTPKKANSGNVALPKQSRTL